MPDSSAACTGFGDCGCDVCCPEPGSGCGVGHDGRPLGRSGDTEPRPGTSAASTLRELAARATPGPWRVRRASLDADHPDAPPATYYIVAGEEKWHRNKGHFHPEDAMYPEDEHWVTEYASDRDYYTPEGGMSKEDAEFIVALAWFEEHRRG